MKSTAWARELDATSNWVVVDMTPPSGDAASRLMVQNTGSGDLHLCLEPVSGQNYDLHVIIKGGDTYPRFYDRIVRKIAYKSATTTSFILEGWAAAGV